MKRVILDIYNDELNEMLSITLIGKSKESKECICIMSESFDLDDGLHITIDKDDNITQERSDTE